MDQFSLRVKNKEAIKMKGKSKDDTIMDLDKATLIIPKKERIIV